MYVLREENRGIDAPEGKMPFGKEAKDELTKIVQGKSLRVLVYGEDRYGRSVGDIYCNGLFVQVSICSQSSLLNLCQTYNYLSFFGFFWLIDKELMLKKGFAWHYAAYDNRKELETVSHLSFANFLNLNWELYCVCPY